MALGVRVIVLNCDETYAAELRAKLLKIDGVRIVAEVDEPALFASGLQQFPAELALVNIDPDPEALIALAGEILEANPDLCLFAISESNEAELILRAMRAGFREFLVRPLEQDQLYKAIERFTKSSPAQAVTGKLICVLGPSGGSGTTVVAANLGCELAQIAKRGAAIVDLDLAFGHIATMLELTPQFTIADLCQTLDSVDPSMVEKALLKHESGAMVLARPQHLVQAQQISAANAAGVLNILCEMFEYVVCDGPSMQDPANGAVLNQADLTLVLVDLIVPSVRNVDRILQDRTSQGYNPERLKLVVNRYSTNSNMLDVEDIEQSLSRRVDFLIPNDYKTVTAAVNMGEPLMTSAPKSKVREAIRQIANSIHNPDENAGRSGQTRQGLLAKVLGK